MPLNILNNPNFFILGAAKSGTSSLHYHMKDHPEIFLTKVKEPTFFSEGFQVVKNPIKYFQLYDLASTEPIRGEASHAYLTDPTTPRVLRGLFPDAKLLVILRNPADRAYSLYRHMIRNGDEYINTFSKALKAEEWRSSSQRFMDKCPQYFYNYLYFQSGLYGQQLQRYFAFFPQSQFHIIKFEDFIANPSSHFKNIFRFLGVDTQINPRLKVRNAVEFTIRCPRIQYYVHNKLTYSKILQKLLRSILKRVNRTRTPPLDAVIRQTLMKRYQDDLRLLKKLTGIEFID